MWTHIVGTYDGTDIRIFRDGVLEDVERHAGDISDLDRPLTFGFVNGPIGSGTWTT